MRTLALFCCVTLANASWAEYYDVLLNMVDVFEYDEAAAAPSPLVVDPSLVIPRTDSRDSSRIDALEQTSRRMWQAISALNETLQSALCLLVVCVSLLFFMLCVFSFRTTSRRSSATQRTIAVIDPLPTKTLSPV